MIPNIHCLQQLFTIPSSIKLGTMPPRNPASFILSFFCCCVSILYINFFLLVFTTFLQYLLIHGFLSTVLPTPPVFYVHAQFQTPTILPLGTCRSYMDFLHYINYILITTTTIRGYFQHAQQIHLWLQHQVYLQLPCQSLPACIWLVYYYLFPSAHITRNL